MSQAQSGEHQAKAEGQSLQNVFDLATEIDRRVDRVVQQRTALQQQNDALHKEHEQRIKNLERNDRWLAFRLDKLEQRERALPPSVETNDGQE